MFEQLYRDEVGNYALLTRGAEQAVPFLQMVWSKLQPFCDRTLEEMAIEVSDPDRWVVLMSPMGLVVIRETGFISAAVALDTLPREMVKGILAGLKKRFPRLTMETVREDRERAFEKMGFKKVAIVMEYKDGE